MKKTIIHVVLVLVFGFILPKSVEAASYRVTTPSTDVVEITCQKSDTNCGYSDGVLFTNDSGQNLFDNVYWTSGNNIVYSSTSQGYTSEQTEIDWPSVVEPEQSISTAVRVTNPGVVGTHYNQLYIDGRVCNTEVDPWDCYYYGAKSLTVVVNVVDDPAPTATSTPTATPAQPTPTPTSVPNPTSAPASFVSPSPTMTPAPSNTESTGESEHSEENNQAPINQTEDTSCQDSRPVVPELFSATREGGTTVLLSWSGVDEANSYAISYGTQSGNYDYGVPNAGDVESYRINSLNEDNNYYFVVQAKNGCAVSKASNEVSVEAEKKSVVGSISDRIGKDNKVGETLSKTLSTLSRDGGEEAGGMNYYMGLLVVLSVSVGGCVFYLYKKGMLGKFVESIKNTY